MSDFREREVQVMRDERERSKQLRNDKTGSDLKLYIENAAQQIKDVSSFYYEQKLDKSRGIEGKMSRQIKEGIKMLSSRQRLQGNKLDESGYLSRGIEQKPRNLNRRACIEEVLRWYRGGTNKSLNKLSVVENKIRYGNLLTNGENLIKQKPHRVILRSPLLRIH